MIRLCLLLIFLSIGLQASAQRFNLKMTLEGVEREYIVVRPSGNPPAQGYPVVFMLHGTTGDGEKFYTISGWKELGEKEKFITVFPSSLAYCVTQPNNHVVTKWNNGDLQSQLCPNQNPKDDVLFIRRAMDSIKARFPVNAAKCYMVGFSNGGVMSAKIAMELGDIFAASVCGSGALDELDVKPAPLANKIPMWFLIGCEDQILSDLIGRTLPFNDSALVIMDKLVTRHLTVLELEKTYRKDSILGSLSYTYTTPLPGASKGYFRFTSINKMEHIWPNGVNFPINMVPIAWAWFNSFEKTTAVVQAPASAQELVCYPNPAAGNVTIVLPSDQMPHELSVWDATGKRIWAQQIPAGVTQWSLDVSHLGQGWHTCQLQNARGTWQCKLLLQ